MLPYLHIPDSHLGPIPIHVFGIIVAIGVFVGISLARWRARKVGLDAQMLESFISWMLAFGFIGAHVIDWIFYHRDQLVAKPWTILFLWEGISSFGGFVGAFAGIVAWKRWSKYKGTPLLPLADCIVSVFPISWVFGRLGCSIEHDHPGRLTSADNPFAVAFPGGARYDLGLLEFFWAIVISLVVVSLWRKKTRVGVYIAVVSILYAPMRFTLDFLRITEGTDADPRYFGLTIAQWLCVGLLGYGIYMAVRVFNQPAPPVSEPEAKPEAKPEARTKPKSKAKQRAVRSRG